MKQEYYKKLNGLVDNFITNNTGIYEIISLVKKMIRLGYISKYKLKQVNELCNIDITA